MIHINEFLICEINWGYTMIISERILKILKDKKMTQAEFAKQTGIAASTVSEWKKKKTNPSADKIMDICQVLQVTPQQLLTGEGIDSEEELVYSNPAQKFSPLDIRIIEDYHNLQEEQKKRFRDYIEALKKLESLENI